MAAAGRGGEREGRGGWRSANVRAPPYGPEVWSGGGGPREEEEDMLLFWRKNGGICREAEEGCYGAQVTLQNRSLAAR